MKDFQPHLICSWKLHLTYLVTSHFWFSFIHIAWNHSNLVSGTLNLQWKWEFFFFFFRLRVIETNVAALQTEQGRGVTLSVIKQMCSVFCRCLCKWALPELLLGSGRAASTTTLCFKLCRQVQVRRFTNGSRATYMDFFCILISF